MLISHKKRFIYTKTFKTASTSVEAYFEPYCLPEGMASEPGPRDEYVSDTGIIGYRGANPLGTKKWFNHMPAWQIRAQISHEIWDTYLKFCVVRNPFEKLVSGFASMERNTRIRMGSGMVGNIDFAPYEGFVWSDPGPAGDSLIEKFRNWIRSGGRILDRDKYMIDQEICVDYFIRYESLGNGIEQVGRMLGIDYCPERILRLKSGIRDPSIPVRDYYDQETRAIVEDIYSFELDYFRYDFPSSD